jgi:hypothetical protein
MLRRKRLAYCSSRSQRSMLNFFPSKSIIHLPNHSNQAGRVLDCTTSPFHTKDDFIHLPGVTLARETTNAR